MNFTELRKRALAEHDMFEIGGWMTNYDKDYITNFLTTKFSADAILDVAELGVFQGGSSLIYLLALPKCKFHAIDDWKGGPASPGFKDIKEGFLHFTKKFSDRVFIYSGDSIEVGKQWNTELDICMIDGNHDAQYPLEDINNFSKWVRVGGYILVDDYDMENVKQAVNNTLSSSSNWKFIHDTTPDGGKVIIFQKV